MGVLSDTSTIIDVINMLSDYVSGHALPALVFLY